MPQAHGPQVRQAGGHPQAMHSSILFALGIDDTLGTQEGVTVVATKMVANGERADIERLGSEAPLEQVFPPPHFRKPSSRSLLRMKMYWPDGPISRVAI